MDVRQLYHAAYPIRLFPVAPPLAFAMAGYEAQPTVGRHFNPVDRQTGLFSSTNGAARFALPKSYRPMCRHTRTSQKSVSHRFYPHMEGF